MTDGPGVAPASAFAMPVLCRWYTSIVRARTLGTGSRLRVFPRSAAWPIAGAYRRFSGIGACDIDARTGRDGGAVFLVERTVRETICREQGL